MKKAEYQPIEIKNIKNNKKLSEPYDFFIDRRTPAGNPYIISGFQDRNQVCDLYKESFYRRLSNNKKFREYIHNLVNAYKKYKKLRLFCNCTPKRCHGETIKTHIENMTVNFKQVTKQYEQK
jgi:hypothetical protein